jgi:KipI family sensor histidine kinase inhibitor
VCFGERISLDSHGQVTKLLRLLEAEPVDGVRNLHPSYCSLLVTFDALRLSHEELKSALGGYLDRMGDLPLPEPRLVEIPVSYGGEYGPDLNDVAELHGISAERVFQLHAATEYVVYFLGFVPGLAYLGELPDLLVTPRLATPRRSVVPGSVGIAGRQTGVYPFSTPGGWRLIGRTPLAMFQADSGSLLQIGDRVRFVPISPGEFAASEQKQAKI